MTTKFKSGTFYQKYRPSNFATIEGQTVIIQILQQQILNQTIHHAYLFSGKQGIGKTTTARVFAKTINCLKFDSKQLDRCFECVWCLKLQNQIVDINEIDAASNNGVENIRALQDDAVLAPLFGRFKVYIIDEVHMLSRSAFNAFLKILEEPPRHVVFILATTEIEKIPSTIISRCHHFQFQALPITELVTLLSAVVQKEKLKIQKPALDLIAEHTNGAVREALNLLEQTTTLFPAGREVTTVEMRNFLGLLAQNKVFALIEQLLKRNFTAVWETINQWGKHNVDFAQIAEQIVQIANKIRTQAYTNHSAFLKNYPFLNTWTTHDLKLLTKISTLVINEFQNFQLKIASKTLFETLILEIIVLIPPLYEFEEKTYLMLLKNNDRNLKASLKANWIYPPELVSVSQEITLLAATAKALLFLANQETLQFFKTAEGKMALSKFSAVNKWTGYKIHFISHQQRDFIKKNFLTQIKKINHHKVVL